MTSKSETTASQVTEQDARVTKGEPSQAEQALIEALRRRRAQIAAYI